jgi:hypothetical protein
MTSGRRARQRCYSGPWTTSIKGSIRSARQRAKDRALPTSGGPGKDWDGRPLFEEWLWSLLPVPELPDQEEWTSLGPRYQYSDWQELPSTVPDPTLTERLSGFRTRIGGPGIRADGSIVF